MEEKKLGLCNRCEYRAQFKEQGHAPRCECGSNYSVISCYSYRPVRPLIIRRNNNDGRPLLAGFLYSARGHAIKTADQLVLKPIMLEDGMALVYCKETFMDRFHKKINDFKLAIMRFKYATQKQKRTL